MKIEYKNLSIKHLVIVLVYSIYTPLLAQKPVVLENNSVKAHNYVPKKTPEHNSSTITKTNKILKNLKTDQVNNIESEAEKVIIVSKTAPKGTDIYNLPLFGHFDKTPSQLALDNLFIEDCLKEFSDRKAAAAFFVNMAWSYLEEGDHETALKRFNYAFLLNPASTDSYWGLGVIEYQKSNFPLAIDLMNRGLSVDSTNYILMVDLATIHLKVANLNQNTPIEIKAAKDLIKKAIEIQPLYTNAFVQLSLTYYLDGDYTLAWDAIHAAIDRNPQEVSQNHIDQLLEKMADPKGIFKK